MQIASCGQSALTGVLNTGLALVSAIYGGDKRDKA